MLMSVYRINNRYFMQGEQVSFQAVLPTLKGKHNLVSQEAKPQAQFLVGYRNILVCKGENIQWGLIKSKLHCGRAFVYPIQQSKTLAIQQFKNEEQIIQTVSNTYIFLKNQKDIRRLNIKLNRQNIEKLLQDIGGVNKINLNILKNAFDTYEEYRNALDVEAETSLNVEQNFKQLQLTEKVQIEYKSKTLSGNALKQLPFISKETGKWDGQKTIEIKILEH